MGEMVRTHVLLPRELVERVDEVVGPRRRSEFVAETLRKELDRRRLLATMEAVQEAARRTGGPDVPGWETPESAAAWVRAQRRVDDDPWDRSEAEPDSR